MGGDAVHGTANLRYAAGMSKPRPPRRTTKTSLENAALHYLERFASSAENLRRVLLRRVERAAHFHGDDPAEGAALVDELIARYRASGLLNDKQYAEGKCRSLHRRGSSTRTIRQHLATRGVAAELVDAALGELSAEDGGSADELDLAAAQAFARRRRLGPYRPGEARDAHRTRDLAALGRAGFTFAIARTVVDGDAES